MTDHPLTEQSNDHMQGRTVSPSAYRDGCRCDGCRAAATAAKRRQRAAWDPDELRAEYRRQKQIQRNKRASRS